MTCNCGSGDTPEYYITLDGVGVDGYSPEVNVVDDTSSSFKIEVVNKSNTQQTPAIPKLSYITNTYVSNTSLASTLSAYSTTAQINTALDNKLNKDGSNANSNITLNGIRMYKSGAASFITTPSSTLNIVSTANNNIYIQASGTGKLHYTHDGLPTSSNEVAIKGDIPTVGNGTITITQNGVTKGTFTTNQSGNTTISLDSGVTNPLKLNSHGEAGTGFIEIEAGATGADNIIYIGQNTSGAALVRQLILLSDVADNITLTDNAFGTKKLSINTMTGSDSITGGAAGLVPAPSAGDQDKFLKGDGTWDTVGGGGSSYTAGTGIDITNDVISVEGTQEFDTVTLANTIGNNGEGLYGTIADGSSTLPLVRIDSLDNTLFGNTTSELYLFGDNTRPYYNNSTNTLALSSDIPTVPTITTGSTNGTIAVGGTDISVYGLGSAAYTSSSDYATSIQGGKADTAMQPNSNDSITGTKEFTTGTAQFDNGSKLEVRGQSTLFLRGNSVAHGAYLGLGLRGNDSANNVTINQMYFTANNSSDIATLRLDGLNLSKSPYIYNGYTRLGQISVTNSNINFTTGTGTTLQYNGNEVATVNNIPDVSQLQEKLTAGTGINLGSGTWQTPIMTSSSQDGFIITESQYNAQAGWCCFDGQWNVPDAGWWTGNDAVLPCWVEIELPNAQIPTEWIIKNEVATPANFKDAKLQGSNDGSTWDDLYTISNRPDTAGYQETYNISTSTAYKYLRIYITSAYGDSVSIQQMQINGIRNAIISVDTTVIATKSYVDSVAGTGYSSSLIIS